GPYRFQGLLFQTLYPIVPKHRGLFGVIGSISIYPVICCIDHGRSIAFSQRNIIGGTKNPIAAKAVAISANRYIQKLGVPRIGMMTACTGNIFVPREYGIIKKKLSEKLLFRGGWIIRRGSDLFRQSGNPLGKHWQH